MKEFNSKERCSKCGEKEIRTFHCEGSMLPSQCSLAIEREHLHRRCERCKYEWAEKCIKKEKI